MSNGKIPRWDLDGQLENYELRHVAENYANSTGDVELHHATIALKNAERAVRARLYELAEDDY